MIGIIFIIIPFLLNIAIGDQYNIMLHSSKLSFLPNAILRV